MGFTPWLGSASLREWTLTFSSELSLWELEFQWTPEFSENDCKGQNSLNWRIPYIIGKLLESKCLKGAHTTHLNIQNISYGKKKGRESNWQFDYQPLKVRNRPDFFACRWCAKYCWKALNDGYNFVLNFTSIKGLHTKLWAPKVTWVLGQNDIWVHVLCSSTEYTIRGKVVAFPKFGMWWVLWVRVCPWLIRAPKVFQLCTNQLVVWFM